MIQITKEEKMLLAEMFPYEKFPRTMAGDSKRHHYFCTESEKLMRAIAGSNSRAAEIVKELESRRRLRDRRRKVWSGGADGSSETA